MYGRQALAFFSARKDWKSRLVKEIQVVVVPRAQELERDVFFPCSLATGLWFEFILYTCLAPEMDPQTVDEIVQHSSTSVFELVQQRQATGCTPF